MENKKGKPLDIEHPDSNLRPSYETEEHRQERDMGLTKKLGQNFQRSTSLDLLRTAVKAQPENLEMLDRLALELTLAATDPINKKQSNRLHKEALACYLAIADLDPTNIHARTMAAHRLLSDSNPHQALEMADECLLLDPSNNSVQLSRADALLALERRPEALQALKNAALAEEKCGNPESAGAIYYKILVIEPEDREATIGYERTVSVITKLNPS